MRKPLTQQDKQIQQFFNEYYKEFVKKADRKYPFLGKGQRRVFVQRRQSVMAMLYEMKHRNFGVAQIGEIVEKKHCLVYDALYNCQMFVGNDKSFTAVYRDIERIRDEWVKCN